LFPIETRKGGIPEFADVLGQAGIAKPIKEAKTKLVIPTYDVNTGKVYLFKTPHHSGYSHHADFAALDVALATSAAPTYFPAHTITGRSAFIDGGLWANCPGQGEKVLP
jgi:patatin-like phospholipase/acyl hydrolase